MSRTPPVPSAGSLQPPNMYEVNSVEAELRQIDDDFVSGRMNAFGPPSAQDEVQKELKKIAELEMQVFYRVSVQLRTNSDVSRGVQQTLREVTEASRASTASAVGGGTQLDQGPTGGSGGPSDSQADQQHQQKTAAEALAASDKAFEEIGKHFRAMEATFSAVGQNMNTMGSHVSSLNDMIRSVHGGAA